MHRWPAALLLLALTGCVSEPGPDFSEADGPYYYDGGGYYAAPRPVDLTVEQRAYYSQPYHGYPAYPHYYGGYRRFHDRPDTHYRHDGDDHNGPDRDRSRGERSPTPPPRVNTDDRDRTRAVPDRPSKIRSESNGPTRSSGGPSRSGGPHGGKR